MVADLHGLTAVTLLRRYEFDAAVAVLVVVPVDKAGVPSSQGSLEVRQNSVLELVLASPAVPEGP